MNHNHCLLEALHGLKCAAAALAHLSPDHRYAYNFNGRLTKAELASFELEVARSTVYVACVSVVDGVTSVEFGKRLAPSSPSHVQECKMRAHAACYNAGGEKFTSDFGSTEWHRRRDDLMAAMNYAVIEKLVIADMPGAGTTGITPNVQPKKEPTMNIDALKVTLATQTSQVETTAALIKQEEERQAKLGLLNEQIDLAYATQELLGRVKHIEEGTVDAGKVWTSPHAARFRKELQPLAQSYGYKIVLVADRKTASIVKVA